MDGLALGGSAAAGDEFVAASLLSFKYWNGVTRVFIARQRSGWLV